MASSCIRLPSTGAAAVSKSPLSPPSPSSHFVSRSRADLSVAFRIECHSPFSGSRPSNLYRSRSAEIGYGDRRKRQTLRRAASVDLQIFDEDDEFVKKLEELALGGNPGDLKRQKLSNNLLSESAPSTSSRSDTSSTTTNQPFQLSGGFGPASMAIPQGGIANSCDMPASLRLIKQKKKKQCLAALEEGFREVGESARSSVYKAFSSMVFMIREMHSFTIHMRQGLFYEDIQEILSRVQQDMHASFVWLFQQIFSGTPTLMVSVMLLLANFTVYSMTNSVAMAAPLSQPEVSAVAVVVESSSVQKIDQFDRTPAVKTISPGKTASVGGNSGGGGKVRPVAGATDDGQSKGPSSSQQITHAGTPTVAGDGDVSMVREEDEEAAWNHMVEEAKQMQADFRDQALMDQNVLKWLVKPVTVWLQDDQYVDYKRTDLDYQLAVQQDPQNSLLLTNFAQFLQLVLHDNERAEYYFKKATAIQPADAEAFSKYANFLWLVKNDTEAAEENFLEAIQADPGNSYHAANYAHFLWNTGGEDTCFPAWS